MPTEVGDRLIMDGFGIASISRSDWVVVLIVSNSFIALVSAATEPTSTRKITLAADGYDEHRALRTLAFLRKYCGENCDGLP